MEKYFTVCITHDVDHVTKTFQYLTHFLKNIYKTEFMNALYHIQSLFLKEHYWCFEKIMDIEHNLGIKSTFYFLNESYPFKLLDPITWPLSLGYYDIFNKKVSNIIKELSNNRFEIGLHGSYLSHNNEKLLLKEKHDLESIIDKAIVGIRQHYLKLNEYTWLIQKKAGFIYDASYGFTDNIGFKGNNYTPFNPFEDNEFFVVPLAIMDFCAMGKVNPLKECSELIELAQNKNACLVINWHQRMFNEKEFPGYTKLFSAIIKESMKRNANFCTVGEYISEL